MTKTPQRPTLLIPGASGRLGRLLRGAVTASPPEDADVIFATRDGSTDLHLDANALPEALPAVDVIVALWGVTAGTDAELARNAELVQSSAELARRAGARTVLHMSSAAVYGPGTSLTEASPLSPANEYGRAKQMLEHCVTQLKGDAITHCCLRLANVVGADSLAPALSAPEGTPIRLTRFDDGRGPLRSYVGPGHLMQILIALGRLPAHALPDVLNIAAHSPVEMEALGRAAGKDIHWVPATRQDRQVVTLSTQRLSRLASEAALPKTAQDMITDWTEAETHI